jgi:hypothetical protein
LTKHKNEEVYPTQRQSSEEGSKKYIFGWLVIEKVKARQRARLTNVRHGGVNSKLFYLRANDRKRKKHIQVLQTEQGLAFKHDDKAKEIERHFGQVLGTKRARQTSLNWEALSYPTFNLVELESNITGEEVKVAIESIPKENEPGLDSFIGAFYHKCWGIVKGNVIVAVQ